jgi:ribosomal protein L18E
MPRDIRMEEIARSMTRKGRSTSTPIWKAVVSSLRMNAGAQIRRGTSSSVFGSGTWAAW